MARTSELHRKTRETDVQVEVNLEGRGDASVETGVGFFDHMLELLARHSLVDLKVRARGDLQVDPHHTVEDVGLTLGAAILQALGDKRGITRYGHFTLPMDEVLVTVAIDFSGRSVLVADLPFRSPVIGTFPSELVEEFLRALANAAKVNLHVRTLANGNSHHLAEAVFKALGRALRMAVAVDPREPGVPSTKGSL
ncbi:MAG: imidazoleglycerol-phosphate dehydratase HisB [Tepidisphaerales bacterium]